MAKKRKSSGGSMVGDMISLGIGNIVGAGMLGASSNQVAALPAGTARDISGTAVGLGSVALLGHNIGFAKKAFKDWDK